MFPVEKAVPPTGPSARLSNAWDVRDCAVVGMVQVQSLIMIYLVLSSASLIAIQPLLWVWLDIPVPNR